MNLLKFISNKSSEEQLVDLLAKIESEEALINILSIFLINKGKHFTRRVYFRMSEIMFINTDAEKHYSK